ncbi:UNVERIFIED_CONTAM: hypothetical protein GTU68_032431 [Idotea baltica]|nr:hypothetical protein [Idotea baltica]
MAEGAKVAFTYRSSAEKADAIVSKYNADSIIAIKSDASKYDEAESMIAAVLEKFGITKDTLMLRMSEEHWDNVMEVNLKSVFNVTKHVIKPMMKNRSGSIINMSSVVGVFGNAGQANYAASKAGILGFTKSIAKEVGSRNIRCNAVAPGFIATEMTHELDEKTQKSYTDSIPLKRFGEGEDVANICTFLASDMSSYVTGQVLSVCGGMNI